jgi:hypothetical protein
VTVTIHIARNTVARLLWYLIVSLSNIVSLF